MNNPSDPLNVTITGGTIALSGSKPVSFVTEIDNYQGDPLFCKAFVHGATLVLLIDQDGPSQLTPGTSTVSISRASVTVKYGQIDRAWAGELPQGYFGGPMTFAIQRIVGSPIAKFVIGLAAPAVGSSGWANRQLAASRPRADAAREDDDDPCGFLGGNPPVLGYLAIEVDGSPGTLQYYYLTNGPPITITNYTRLTKATIVPPECNVGYGSIGGPMGIELTSS